MATGADAKFWEDARLRGVLKHGIVEKYLPVFLSRTSAQSRRAVYFDGYAGKGQYESGKLGSPGLIMKFALDQKYSSGRDYTLLLYERDRELFESLSELAERYRKRGLSVRAECRNVTDVLNEVRAMSVNQPMFAFLDPCGVGVPFDSLVRLINRHAPRHYPPTEVLLNFNHAAIWRIGGHLRSPRGIDTTIRRFDSAVGGTWWHDAFKQSGEDVVKFVVEGFKTRLADATGMFVYSVAVSDGPGKPPVYDLVFGTRHPRGIWNFADKTALSIVEWWIQSEAKEDQLGLFPRQPRVEDFEEEAVPLIAQNIRRLLHEKGAFVLGDHPSEVFGDYLGRVRTKVARKAVKLLYEEGLTATTGK